MKHIEIYELKLLQNRKEIGKAKDDFED